MSGPNSIYEKKIAVSVNQLELGKVFYYDTSRENNCENAFKFISRSAEQGNAEAQFMLGNLYALGHGTEKSHEKAYFWYTKSAIQGYKKALIRIHNLYQEDIGVHCRGQLNSGEDEWNTDEFKQANKVRELNEYRLEQMKLLLNGAIDYYTNLFKKHQSSKQDDPEAQQTLGFLYQHGYGVKKITKWAIECYTTAAEQGFIDAQYNLGYLYQHNTSIKFNYHKAFQWYSEAAKGGNIAAQIRLAYFYEKGLIGEIDAKLVLFWYTNAANLGSSEAQLALGKIYRKLHNNYKSNSEAVKWYSMAAQQGNHIAQNCLFQLNQSGASLNLEYDNVISQYSSSSAIKERLCSKLRVDIEKMSALSHITQLKKLAQHALVGDGNAMYNIGRKYYEGIDFNRDMDVAFRWIKNSAKAGFKKAYLMLAEMHERGDVVEQNYHKTSVWIKTGMKKKDDRFQCILGVLYSRGIGVRQDYLEASKWFTISADRGNSMALYQLGLLFYFGRGVRENRDQANKYFYNSVIQGDIGVLYKFGKRLFLGGNDEGNRLAMRVLKYAAIHGIYDAWIYLGNKFNQPIDPQLNPSKFNNCYNLMTNSGSGRSQYELALKYLKGGMANRDYTKAFRLFKIAACKGLLKAKRLISFPMVAHYENLHEPFIIEMFNTVSNSNIESMEFNIGFFYEINHKYNMAYDWYSKAINKGDARALYRLGILDEDGKAASRDLKQAINYYEKAHKKKEIGATYRLGCMYLNGRGVKQDLMQAFQLFTEASNQGHNESRKMLMLSESKTVEKKLVSNYGQEDPADFDKKQQMRMLEVAANNEIALQYRLSLFYEKNGDPRAAEWLINLSRYGIVDVYYRLGYLYEEGRGVRQNYLKAIELYQEAVYGNNENAMYRLARLYYYGIGVNLDFLKAYNLYNKASNLGHSLAISVLDISQSSDIQSIQRIKNRASEKISRQLRMYKSVAKDQVDLQYKLGFFYENNEAYQDYAESFHWYNKAVEREHKDATYHLGHLYEKGLGVVQDYGKAIAYYEKAKDLGSEDARFKLGLAYHYGLGVSIDPFIGVEHYIRSAENGQSESQYTLGKLNETGELVKKNILEAIRWYTRASLQGHEKSIERLYEFYGQEFHYNCFHENMFQILLKFERSEKKTDTAYHNVYGSMLYKLGHLYINGQGIPKSLDSALKCFSDSFYVYHYSAAKRFLSLEQNNGISGITSLNILESYWNIKEKLDTMHQYDIGMFYYKDALRLSALEKSSPIDNSTPKSSTRAIEYLTLSANNRHKESQEMLAKIYLENKLVQKKPAEILKLHQTFARLASESENYNRGMNYYNGNGVERDYGIALIYLEAAAKNEHGFAKIQLGDMYRQGVGVDLNYKTALSYYNSSTEKLHGYRRYCQGKKYSILEDVNQRNELSLLYFKAASEKGDSGAQLELGYMYLKGEAVTRDYERALEEYKKSTDEMTGEDCYAQGERFFEGKDVVQDYVISRMFFEKAAEKNNPYGNYKLGEIFFKGLGLNECDDNNAFEYYKKAAKEKITEAQSQLAYMYLQGRGTKQSFDAALTWYKASTQRMTADECFSEGKKFFINEYIERNYEISYNYIKASAKKGHGEAALMLGEMYLEGTGTEKNPNKAFKWYENFATRITVEKCNSLGNKYYTDNGAEENREISFIFFKEAAKKGDCDAQIKVGNMYIQGDGTALDHDMALKWYGFSTEKMDGDRCYSLGVTHFAKGHGLPIQYKISFLYFRAAYKKGNNNVHAKLGSMYLEGLGTEKNQQKAFSYYKKALANGDSSVQFQLDFLYSIGIGMGPNDKEIENYHKKQAQKMAPDKHYQEGEKFYVGNIVPLNYTLARFYFTKAANKKYHKAYDKLGEIYSKGYGVESNSGTARHYFTLSASEMTPEECLDKAKKYHSNKNKEADYIASFSYYKEAAENGNLEAQKMLGEMYREGLGIKKDDKSAFKWYRKSAQNMPEADSYEYGKALLDQKSTSSDLMKKIGLIYLEESAEAGYFKAQAELGDVYLRGRVVEQDTKKAVDFYKRCVQNMESDESYLRGEKSYDDIDKVIGNEISLIFLKEAAKKGNVRAHTMLGNRYFNGAGVAKDEKKAIYHFRMAAANGHSEAQARLGDMYLKSTVADTDYTKAKEWYEKSTENMPSYDCYLRGKRFFDGSGGQQDYHIARIFLQSAAEKGNIKALTIIGNMYFNGWSFTKNYNESFKNYRSAAIKGDIKAQIQLANMYSQGLGTKKNIDEALKWCEASVKVMSANECYDQAITFINDSKLPDKKLNQTFELALFYVMSAAEKGNKDAQETLNSLFKQHIRNNPLDNLPNELHDLATIEMNGYDCYLQGRDFFEGNDVSVNYQASFIYFRKAAEKGYRKAYTKLGDMYLQGLGINSDLKEALKWYKISSLEMSGAECYKYGNDFYNKKSSKENLEVSFVYFKAAAEKRYIKSYTKLGEMYLEGEGVNTNEESALHYYKKAAEAGDINAEAKVQIIEAQFLKDESDRYETLKPEDEANKRNTPHDLYLEGKRYLHEADSEIRYIKAHKYFLKAGQAGYSEAYVQLGDMYLKGLGVEKDYKKAKKMYENSVRNMDDADCYRTGERFFSSTSKMDVDYKISMIFFEKAAEKGSINACVKLGEMYYKGLGVDKDHVTSFKNYEIAAENGNTEAQRTLGSMYHRGIGVEKDIDKALHWYALGSPFPGNSN